MTMGALATFPPWTPEDDLLLKNAVEAGASLESLAKGAVQFSRKYSFGEIRDRWYSLLYDPVISLEASICMANFELSASPLPSKFFKFGQSKEQKIVSVKRKADSVRTSYYAMCKRTRHDTLDFKDFNFLVDPENGNCVVNGNEPLPETCEPECPTLNHFSNVDPPHYDLPENTIDVDVAFNGVTANGFYTGVDENFPIDQINITEKESQILEDNVPLTGAADELADPVDLDLDNLITDEVLQEMSMSAFGQINNGPANLRSEYGEDYNMFDSPELDCGNSFDNLQLSSLPDVSVWRAEEPDIRCGSLKDSLACEEGYLEELSNSLLNFTGDEELFLMDAVGKDGIDKSYYDGLSSLLLNSPIADCPDQIHEKDETELLLTSHADVRNPSVSCRAEVDNNARKAETDLLVAFDAHLRDPPVSCRAEVDDIAASQANGVQVVKLEFQMPTSASVKDPRFPELTNGVIVCTLNTEDPVVPSNDDVFLPFNEPPPTISYSPKSASRKSNKPVASSVNDYGYKASGRGKVLMQVEHNNSIGLGACASSQATGSRGLAEPVYGSKMKRKLSNGHESHTPSRSAVISSGGLGGNNNATNTNHGPLHANPKEKLLRVCSGKQLSNNMTKFSHDKPALGNGFRNHVQPNGSSLIQEQHAALPLEDYQLQHAETGSSDVMQSELVVNPQKLDEDQKLDEEEQYIESDDDVPYYSDVEAMVLDMDLDPDDHDLYDNEEVSRYQHEESKRAIIRLEQGTHSHLQRAMASHGALAMLYGRHSKHYIKKTEVLLGRATESVHVDIDLGKGGCAHAISRRQAIIKMDIDGSFYIKNIGKSIMLVNHKELHTGQSQRLHPSYLIELKGTAFIFETNQSRLKQ